MRERQEDWYRKNQAAMHHKSDVNVEQTQRIQQYSLGQQSTTDVIVQQRVHEAKVQKG